MHGKFKDVEVEIPPVDYIDYSSWENYAIFMGKKMF